MPRTTTHHHPAADIPHARAVLDTGGSGEAWSAWAAAIEDRENAHAPLYRQFARLRWSLASQGPAPALLADNCVRVAVTEMVGQVPATAEDNVTPRPTVRYRVALLIQERAGGWAWELASETEPLAFAGFAPPAPL